jgi:hypothetical protein
MEGTMNSYPYVRIWGKLMGSFDWAIEAEVQEAIAQKAPANATFRVIVGADGCVIPLHERRQWSTTDDIIAPGIREKIRVECQRLGIPHPWQEQPF